MESNCPSTKEEIPMLCQICFYQYTQDLPPKVLQCGHTCCLLCLSRILATTEHCAFCRSELTQLDSKEYPTNYALVTVIGELPQYSYTIEDLKKRFSQLIQKHQAVLIALANKRPKHYTEFMPEILQKNVNWLRELLSEEIEENNLRKILQSIEGVEKIINDVCEIASTDHNPEYILESYMFQSSQSYFLKIHDLIAIDGKMVFARQVIYGVRKYAKISVEGNLLFMHALEERDNLDNVTLVDFIDLQTKLLAMKDRVYGFLRLSFDAQEFTRRIMIDMNINNSRMKFKFLNFCSGQLNVSYKSHNYEQEYDSNLESEETGTISAAKILIFKSQAWGKWNSGIISTCVFNDRPRDSLLASDSNCYVSVEKDGSFEIIKFSKSILVQLDNYNIVGTVVDFPEFHKLFEYASCRKIVDCGIAFKYEA